MGEKGKGPPAGGADGPVSGDVQASGTSTGDYNTANTLGQYDHELIRKHLESLCETVKVGDPELAREIRATVDKRLAAWLKESGKADPWDVSTYTLEDAYAPRPPRNFIVEGLIPTPSLSMVYSHPSGLKSMLVGDMAISVAGGLSWLPGLGENDIKPRQTQQAPVYWLDFDNGTHRMHERFEALGQGHGLPPTAPVHYVSMPSPWLDASDMVAIEALARRIEEREARLVVIDCLRDVSGKCDENASEIGDVMSNFRRLAEMTGAAVVIIHHQRKTTGFRTSTGESLRGHSSIAATIDLALLLEREEASDDVIIRATKARGAAVLPFGAKFTYTHKPGTDELAQVKFFGFSVADTSSDMAIKKVVLEMVESDPGLNKTTLKERVKIELPDVGLHRIGRVIERCVKGDELVQESGRKGAKRYYLPGTVQETQQGDMILDELF